MIPKQCPVQRPAYSFTLMRQKETASVLGNGRLQQGPPQVEQVVNQVAAAYHELRVFDADAYMLYCIFCGNIAAQHEWVESTEVKHEPQVG